MKYKHSLEEAEYKEKFGIALSVYAGSEYGAEVARVSVSVGHLEEFIDTKSAYMYLILEGEGVFYIEDEAVEAKVSDLIVVPPNTRFYYLGRMEMVLVTTPAWNADNYKHVRYIDAPV